MRRILLLFLLSVLFIGAKAQCTPDLGTGDGKDGAGNLVSNFLAGNYMLDGTGNFTSAGNVIVLLTSAGNNTLNFNNFTLRAGDTLSFNDFSFLGPIYIYCTGTAHISGVIDVRGKNGGTGNASGCQCATVIQGGTAGVGAVGGGTSGGAGGTARFNPVLINNGTNGTSFGSFAGGGVAGKKQSLAGTGGGGGGGGGGAYGTAGATGAKGTNGSWGATGGNGGATGSVYGDAGLTTIELGTNLLGGSGGGGGASAQGNPDVTTGGGGGGGGGGILLATRDIDITGGTVTAAGGNGGVGGAGCPGCGAHIDAYAGGGGGGGGSGGTIAVQYVDSCTGCVGGVNIVVSGGAGGLGGTFAGTVGGAGGVGGDGRYLITKLCDIPTAVAHVSRKAVNVYPNPAKETVTFDFLNEQSEAGIELSDLSGRTVKSMNFSGRHLTMNRDGLAPGAYIYKVISGKRVESIGKIVIM